MGNNVYVGLFNASYSASTPGTSKFGEFRFFPDNSACLGQAGQSPNEFPPGLTTCNELLEDRSFELNLGDTPWVYELSSGISQSSTGERTGNFSLFAPTFDATFYAPAFSQKITLPEWIISNTTTLDVSFYKRIQSRMSNASDRKADKFYAVISTGATPGAGTKLTEDIEVLDGSSVVGINQIEPNPLPVTKRFTVTSGIDLSDYAGEEVYLHLYNDSNKTTGTCPTSGYPGGRCATEFYFDDFSMYFCTTQPKPDPIDTRLTGQVTLIFSDGSPERLKGVKVWAYAPDGQVYETFTIQDGLFNFYNLPPGVEYTVFAQYVLVNPNDNTQIETLAASGSVEVTGGNDDTTPATIFLKLITLEPLN
jgi:hypothetical protein